MRMTSAALMFVAATMVVGADVPRFEDYPSPTDWRGPAATVKLITSSERMFRTRLTEADRMPPNFAGHYRIVHWGCGSECAAAAIVDLQSGKVYPPPLGGKGEGWDRWISCASSFEGTGDEFGIDSRLMIVRCGANFDAQGKNRPDVYYMLWEGSGFRQLLRVPPAR